MLERRELSQGEMNTCIKVKRRHDESAVGRCSGSFWRLRESAKGVSLPESDWVPGNANSLETNAGIDDTGEVEFILGKVDARAGISNARLR